MRRWFRDGVRCALVAGTARYFCGQPAASGVSAATGPSFLPPPGSPRGSLSPGSGSAKNATLSAVNCRRSSSARDLRAGKIAISGQTTSQAPQSMHSSGLM